MHHGPHGKPPLGGRGPERPFQGVRPVGLHHLDHLPGQPQHRGRLLPPKVRLHRLRVVAGQ
ncbi:MAG: hypothetical protein C4304_02305, partial [candidate division GAL15 bacterium]